MFRFAFLRFRFALAFKDDVDVDESQGECFADALSLKNGANSFLSKKPARLWRNANDDVRTTADEGRLNSTSNAVDRGRRDVYPLTFFSIAGDLSGELSHSHSAASVGQYSEVVSALSDVKVNSNDDEEEEEEDADYSSPARDYEVRLFVNK